MVAFTPNRGYPYSTTGDPADVAGALEALAEAIDADMQNLDDLIVRRRVALVSSRTSTRQVFAADTVTEARYDFVDLDTDGISNLGVRPTRLTPTAPGFWFCWGSIENPVAQADTRDAFLRVNGGDLTRCDFHINPPSGGSAMITMGAMAFMDGVDDYFTMTFNPTGGLDDFRIRYKRLACVQLTNT